MKLNSWVGVIEETNRILHWWYVYFSMSLSRVNLISYHILKGFCDSLNVSGHWFENVNATYKNMLSYEEFGERTAVYGINIIYSFEDFGFILW